MKNNETYDTIESYLWHKLSDAERIIFEAKVQANPELARQLEEQKVEHMVMDVLVENHLRGKFKKWKEEAETLEEQKIKEEEEVKKPKEEKSSYRGYWLGGIIGLLLCLGGFFWIKNNNKITSEFARNNSPLQETEATKTNNLDTNNAAANNKIFNNNNVTTKKTQHNTPVKNKDKKEDKAEKKNIVKQTIEPHVIIPKKEKPIIDTAPAPSPPVKEEPKTIALTDTLRNIAAAFAKDYFEPVQYARSSSDPTFLDESLQNLEDRQYDLGISKLVEITTLDNKNLKAQYYLGIAYCQNGNFQQAIPHLEIIAKKTYLHTPRAQWELCLVYLQTGNLESAKLSLNKIIAIPTHSYNKNAIKLLERLKERGL